ncbi:MAG: hypothetical protein HY261_05065, partial [Chloroflexi bacterium]|nr:hypothetical protein [Chloroflexota bacterium]
QYLASLGKTREQMTGELKPEALKRVMRSLVLTELRDKEGVKVESAEVDASIDELAQSAGEQTERMRRALNTEANRKSIERSILTRKTLDRLAEIVTGRPMEAAGSAAVSAQQ